MQKGCYSAKIFLTIILRKFIPSKYTRYTVATYTYTHTTHTYPHRHKAPLRPQADDTRKPFTLDPSRDRCPCSSPVVCLVTSRPSLLRWRSQQLTSPWKWRYEVNSGNNDTPTHTHTHTHTHTQPCDCASDYSLGYY